MNNKLDFILRHSSKKNKDLGINTNKSDYCLIAM